ncbi:MAG: hypothetical protein ACD_62C00680G0004 [uncultured bacterium]|nr:MAG: hypothetical protein ACD_62C00680G0004 [uncultured bacterium]
MTTKIKEVFAINKREGQEKAVWIRVGTAFICKDNSINVTLDAVPLTGTLNIRDYVAKGERSTRDEGTRDEGR